MKNKLLILPLLILAALLSGNAVAKRVATDSWEAKAAENKADYLFIEGQNAFALKEYGRYITLTDRAFALDSTDLEIANEWAYIAVTETEADTARPRFERAYNYLKRHFLANTHNYPSGEMFATIARNNQRYADAVMVWEILDSVFPKRDQTALDLASAYLLAYQDGDSAALGKAIAIYDRIESGTGKNTTLSLRKMMAYMLSNDTAAIINDLDALMAAAPEDSYTALFLGKAYAYLGKPESALKYYNLACALDSTNGEAYLERAQIYREKGDSAAFDREVFHALKSNNLEVETKVSILGTYIRELYSDPKQEPRIRELFSELEQVNAGEAQIHELYGLYLYGIKDYAGAADQFSYALGLDPSSENYWVSTVQMSGLANDTLGIIKYASEARRKYPDNYLFPIYEANAYRMLGDVARAKEVVDSVPTDERRNYKAVSQFLGYKGDVYASAGDTIGALTIYDDAINLDPENSSALNNAAYFMTQTGEDLKKAEDYSARSLANDALNPTYLDTYAWVFFKKKDYKMAMHYIDMAMKAFDTGNEEAPSETPEESAEEDGIGEELAPGYEPSADIYDHAGDIYFMNGDPTAALAFWQKALGMDPDNESIKKKVKYKTIFLE